MEDTQAIIDYFVEQRRAFTTMVDNRLNLMLKNSTVEEAWIVYTKMVDYELLKKKQEWGSSIPFENLVNDGYEVSAYDDLYMERGATRDVGYIAERLQDAYPDADLDEWKTAIMKARITAYKCDW